MLHTYKLRMSCGGSEGGTCKFACAEFTPRRTARAGKGRSRPTCSCACAVFEAVPEATTAQAMGEINKREGVTAQALKLTAKFGVLALRMRKRSSSLD